MTNFTKTLKTSALAGVLTLGTAAFATSAHANMNDAPEIVSFDVPAQYLNTMDGASIVLNTLKGQAMKICVQDSPNTAIFKSTTNCKYDLLEQFVASADAPMLTAAFDTYMSRYTSNVTID